MVAPRWWLLDSFRELRPPRASVARWWTDDRQILYRISVVHTAAGPSRGEGGGCMHNILVRLRPTPQFSRQRGALAGPVRHHLTRRCSALHLSQQPFPVERHRRE